MISLKISRLYLIDELLLLHIATTRWQDICNPMLKDFKGYDSELVQFEGATKG